ncbi:14634_t:CDS:2 [Gigaspora margarita]|uniref:14634_t:CDS:1 n=1 Tax=Gigaspora margarita TaxID=4874 RepID=A0ABN7UWI3_GIGMA|nr:14634_t:CDS:2 [Gigaspora margarita]
MTSDQSYRILAVTKIANPIEILFYSDIASTILAIDKIRFDWNTVQLGNPNLRDEEIAAEFKCDRSTVSKILKQKQWSEIREVSEDANALKIASPKFLQIEQTLGMWISTAEQKQLTLTGEVIRQKALEFATLLGVSEDEFKASEVINKSYMPLAFHREGITSHYQLPVDYYNNEKTWMRQDLFKVAILSLEHLVRIFPEIEPASDEDPETQIVQIPEVTTALYETQELIDLTNDTYLQQIIQEYFDYDEFVDTEEALDDERIIELVKNLVVNDNEPDDSVDEEPKITFIEATKKP